MMSPSRLRAQEPPAAPAMPCSIATPLSPVIASASSAGSG